MNDPPANKAGRPLRPLLNSTQQLQGKIRNFPTAKIFLRILFFTWYFRLVWPCPLYPPLIFVNLFYSQRLMLFFIFLSPVRYINIHRNWFVNKNASPTPLRRLGICAIIICADPKSYIVTQYRIIIAFILAGWPHDSPQPRIMIHTCASAPDPNFQNFFCCKPEVFWHLFLVWCINSNVH